MNDSKRKLKILIPILTFGKQGGFRVLSMLATYWTKQGHDVQVISYFENISPYFPMESEVIWLNDDGEKIKNNVKNYNIKNSVYKRMKSIYKYLKKHSIEFDLVLSNQNFSTWPVWLGSRTRNFYYIQAYEPEFYEEKTIKAFIQRTLAKLTYRLPLIRVVNSDIYKNYKKLNSNYVIPPGLDLKIYYPKVDIHKNIKFVVGCIGRKEEWKGSNDVGNAVKILRSRGYEIDFRVAFESIDCDDYELLKPDGDENLSNFYRTLDVLIAPGHIQLGAIHYPVIEAMACKTSVITTGYYPANDENAYIVPIKRSDMIAASIIQIMENPDLARIKSEKAYNDIQQFDWEVVSKEFIKIFHQKLRRI